MAGGMNAVAAVAEGELGGKVELFGVGVSVTTYDHATRTILEAARTRRSFAVSALAVHGLMEAVGDAEFRQVVNDIDLVTPDGQPVRWAMNRLHRTALADRVYGPDLTWRVIEAASAENIGIYLFGSTEATCDAFKAEILRRHPQARVVDVQPDRFREASEAEDAADVERMNGSGAGVVLVGRGCPRQERWVAAHRGRVQAPMLAVGAAFDYGAGNLSSPPRWMQRLGLQWLFRLAEEPQRLWRRYLVTNTRFMLRFALALGARLYRRPPGH
jgi:N-acetylglucosaminyldiphosphoundecaprenol N-acetyl-beta-D-mannosaminyltransferase